MVSDALDGKVSEYRIAHAAYEEFKEDLKDRRDKGVLNPTIVKAVPDGEKTKKAKIDDFFAKQRDLNDFVKKKKSEESRSNNDESREEEIEQSEIEDALVISNEAHSQPDDSVNEIVEEIKKNPKKRKASKDREAEGNQRKRQRKQSQESDSEEEYVL